MAKNIPTLYSNYQECILDIDIFGKIVSTPHQSIQELTDALFEEFKRRKPLPTLEYRRYELSKLVSPDYKIVYNRELELQDNEVVVDLMSSSAPSRITFDDLTPLIQEVQEVFAYENAIDDELRRNIIDTYDLETGESFKPGIKQTEDLVGSTVADTETVLSDDEIYHLGTSVETEEAAQAYQFDDGEDEGLIYTPEPSGVELADGYSADLTTEDEASSDTDIAESEDDDFYSAYEDESEDDSFLRDEQDSEVGASIYEEQDGEDDYSTYEDDGDDYSTYAEDDNEDDDYSVYEDDADDYSVYEDDSDSESTDDDVDDYSQYENEEGVVTDNQPQVSGDDFAESVQPIDSSSKVGNDSFIDSVLDDSLDDIEFIDEPVQAIVVPTPITPAQIPRPTVREPVDRSSEPTDIRQFVRKHPHCEYSFALQYFTKKQIDDAIRIGKVVRKGNILKI